MQLAATIAMRGTQRIAFRFTFAMAAYNLIRMPRLLAEAWGQRATLRPDRSQPRKPVAQHRPRDTVPSKTQVQQPARAVRRYSAQPSRISKDKSEFGIGGCEPPDLGLPYRAGPRCGFRTTAQMVWEFPQIT